MKIKEIPQFTGFNYAVRRQLLPDTQSPDVENVIFKQGRVELRPGYELFGTNLPLDGNISLIDQYFRLRSNVSSLIALTNKDAYQFNDVSKEWDNLSPFYNTGTVACPYGWSTAETVFNSGASYNNSVSTLTDDIFVVCYRDGGNSSYGTARVGQFTGSGINWLTGEIVFNSASTTHISVSAFSDDTFVVCYQDGGNSDYGTSIVGQFTGSGIDWLTSGIVFNSGDSDNISVSAFSDDAFVVCYRDVDNSDYGTSMVGHFLGSAITWLTGEIVFNSADTVNISVSTFSDDTFVVCYTDVGNSSYGTSIVGQFTGAGIDWLTGETVFNSATSDNISVSTFSDDTFVVCYTDVGNSNYGTSRVGQLVGSGIDWLTSEIVFNSGITFSMSVSTFSDDTFVVCYRDAGNSGFGTARIGHFTGSTIDWLIDEEVFNSGDSIQISVTAFPNNTFVVCYMDVDNLDYGTARAGYSSKTIDGAGTTWDITWPEDQYYIKFGTDDINGEGDPDTWYLIHDFVSTTELELDSYAPYGITAEDYVIKESFGSEADDYFDMAFAFADTLGGQPFDEQVAIFVNRIERPMYYDGEAGETLKFLGGDPPRAKYVRTYHDIVMFAHLIDTGGDYFPQTVQWAKQDEPETWPAANYYDLRQNEDWIVGMEMLKQRLFVYKERSITECYFTGNIANDCIAAFEFIENRLVGIGTPTIKTIGNMGNYHIFLGWDDVYMWDGMNVKAIGKEVSGYIRQRNNAELLERSFAVIMEEEGWYCLFLTSNAAYTSYAGESVDAYNPEFPDLVMVYNYIEDNWTVWKTAHFMTAFGYYLTDDKVTWATAEGTWENYPGRWFDRTLSKFAPTNLLGDKDGYIYEVNYKTYFDNGVNIDASLMTKDYPLGDYHKAVKLMQTIVSLEKESSGQQLSISCSLDYGATWSPPTLFDLGGAGQFIEKVQNWARRGEQVRFRIRNVNGAKFALHALRIGFEDAGLLTGR